MGKGKPFEPSIVLPFFVNNILPIYPVAGYWVGATCTPMADSCKCMAKPIEYCEVISLQIKNKYIHLKSIILNSLIIKKVYIKINVYFIYITYLIYLLIYNDQFSVFYHI